MRRTSNVFMLFVLIICLFLCSCESVFLYNDGCTMSSNGVADYLPENDKVSHLKYYDKLQFEIHEYTSRDNIQGDSVWLTNENETDVSKLVGLWDEYNSYYAQIYSMYGLDYYHYEMPDSKYLVFPKVHNAVGNIAMTICNEYEDAVLMINEAYLSSEDIPLDRMAHFSSGYSVVLSIYKNGENVTELTNRLIEISIANGFYVELVNNQYLICRYIGIPHSDYMAFYNMDIDEYTAYIREVGVLEWSVQREKWTEPYVIYYVSAIAENQLKIEVPTNSKDYSIIIDGQNGFVVTAKMESEIDEEKVKQAGCVSLEFRDSSDALILDHTYIVSAKATNWTSKYNECEYGIVVTLNEEGRDLFANATIEAAKNNDCIRIYVDGVLMSQPLVAEAITNGRAYLTFGFIIEEERDFLVRRILYTISK